MAEIKKQEEKKGQKTRKPVEAYPVELQAAIREKYAALDKIDAITKTRTAKSKAEREARKIGAFALLSGLQKLAEKDYKRVFGLIVEVKSSLQPHEGYAPEKAEADKKALDILFPAK